MKNGRVPALAAVARARAPGPLGWRQGSMPASTIQRGRGRPSQRVSRRRFTASKASKRGGWRAWKARAAVGRAVRARDRSRALDAAVDRERHRTSRENVLGGRRRRRLTHGRRQLVGDLAGTRGQRRDPERSRDPQAGAWWHARRGDCAGRRLRAAARRNGQRSERRRCATRHRRWAKTIRVRIRRHYSGVPRSWMPSSSRSHARSRPRIPTCSSCISLGSTSRSTRSYRRRRRTVAVRARRPNQRTQAVLRRARSSVSANAHDRSGWVDAAGDGARTGDDGRFDRARDTRLDRARRRASRGTAHRHRTDGSLCAWRPDERRARRQAAPRAVH